MDFVEVEGLEAVFTVTVLSKTCYENDLVRMTMEFERGLCLFELWPDSFPPYSALHIACYRGCIEIVDAFIDHVLALCAKIDENCPSLLVSACSKWKRQNVQLPFEVPMLLMDHGFDIYKVHQSIYDYNEKSLLAYSSLNCKLPILRTLFDRGIYASDINHPSSTIQYTLLHYATLPGLCRSEEVVLLLLEAGADAEALDFGGRKPDLSWIDPAKMAKYLKQ